ncbi:MAG TPA: hypothetical protein VM537_06550 [Anaerolineae bacterium]|nr:hypothetical protein [Anaerolineae bacterium]
MSKPKSRTYLEAMDDIKHGRLSEVSDVAVASYPGGLFQLVVYSQLELWLCHYFVDEDEMDSHQLIEWRRAEAHKETVYREK